MIRHPDPEVQSLIEILELQRDNAIATAAANCGAYARVVAELVQANQKIEELNTALSAAAQFQESNVIPISQDQAG